MAKNTGKGFRRGAVTSRSQTKSPSGFVTRDRASGKFIDVKFGGQPFKGVAKTR